MSRLSLGRSAGRISAAPPQQLFTPSPNSMSRSSRKSGRRKQHDASHQRNWLTGRYAVTEMLSAGTWPFTRLCVTDEARTQFPAITAMFETVTWERLTELCGNRHHQGLAAQMGPFPYRSLDDLPALIQGVDQPLVVICDRIQDAFNMGAILRCCDAMDVSAVVIGQSQQVGITPQVARFRRPDPSIMCRLFEHRA